MPGFALIVIGVIGLAIVIRLISGSMDGDRVEEYIRARGGRLLTKEWAPFGRGWVGEKDSRIYEITYEDADGRVHRATCKTSAMSGVYFTEDEIIGASASREAVRATEPAGAETNRSDEDVMNRLRRLDRLLAEQLMSREEHSEQRRRILDRL